MRIVSNTSPISNLAIIGRLEFLQRRYGNVHLSPAVAQELAALSHPAGLQAVKAALAAGWLIITPWNPPVVPRLPARLDPGEAAALALALQLKADVLLLRCLFKSNCPQFN